MKVNSYTQYHGGPRIVHQYVYKVVRITSYSNRFLGATTLVGTLFFLQKELQVATEPPRHVL